MLILNAKLILCYELQKMSSFSKIQSVLNRNLTKIVQSVHEEKKKNSSENENL